MITTVTGEFPKEKLGVILPHEHVLIDLRPVVGEVENPDFKKKLTPETRRLVYSDPYYLQDNAFYLNEERALYELSLYAEAGGGAIADATPDEIGRSPAALKRLSEKSGVLIVMGCGHYVDAAHNRFIKENSARTVADELIRDLSVGVGEEKIRAGFIGEIGTSACITQNEWKSVEAALIAQRETGAVIHFHTSLWEENGIQILAKAKEYGVPAEKICIDHIDVHLRKDYCKKLLDSGAYVEFDNCGKEFFIPKRETGLLKGRFAYDYERALLVSELVAEGYAGQILISNDICLKSMLAGYGGNGFAHVLCTIVPMLADTGVSERDINRILRENPQNFFNVR